MRNFDHSNFDEEEQEPQEIQTFYEPKDDTDRYIEMMEAGLANTNLNQQLMATAVRIAESSFLWKFRSIDSKLGIVAKIYLTLDGLLNEEYALEREE